MKKRKIAILGASRGLGRAIAIKSLDMASEILLVSRKENLLNEIKMKAPQKTHILRADFSQEDSQKRTLLELQNFQPQILFYCAGGGPFGNFETKEMKDHLWTWNVNFLFPAEIFHFVLRGNIQNLEHIVFIGSQIAESNPDPGAASYAAAKHALKGLITSIQKEERNTPLKIHLFSPGYMDTEMLPPNAWPRREGLLESPEALAEIYMAKIFKP